MFLLLFSIYLLVVFFVFFFSFPLAHSGFWSLGLNLRRPIWSPRERYANLMRPIQMRDFPWKRLTKGLHNHITLKKDLRKMTENVAWKCIVTSRTKVKNHNISSYITRGNLGSSRSSLHCLRSPSSLHSLRLIYRVGKRPSQENLDFSWTWFAQRLHCQKEIFLPSKKLIHILS